jgi:simple sugar transport system substrate-binding protein/ribose transport system substrate-binding protein
MVRTSIIAAIAFAVASSANAFKLGIIAFQMSAETHARFSNSGAVAGK